MKSKVPDYGLENLLEYDGRVHHLGDGYWIKFKIERTELTDRRPHGLSYSFCCMRRTAPGFWVSTTHIG